MPITELELNPPVARVFTPLLVPRRYKGGRGGRGGAKSWFFGAQTITEMFSQHTRMACIREVQNSIKDSVKQLLEDWINRLTATDPETGKEYSIAPAFKITEREIVCKDTDSLAVFRGLQNHTSTSIKSLESFTRAWYEEAQTLTKRSVETALPTFRTNSEQWFSYNPDSEKDPVDVLFADNIEPIMTPNGPFGRRAPGEGDPDFACVHVNYYDNPWFPEELRRDMERDRQRDPDKYGHVWAGGYRKNSEAQVFKNWRVERFDPPGRGVALLGGADWGFSVDPTAAVIIFIVGRTLYVWREVYQVGCEIDRTPALFDKLDPEWTEAKAADPNWKALPRRISIRADSSRPDTISLVRRAGYSKLIPAIKGQGSVEDGVEFLKSYDIVVHPDCRHTIDELTFHSYVVDKKTEEITGKLEDKKNHMIDSLRYAVENVRRQANSSQDSLGV